MAAPAARTSAMTATSRQREDERLCGILEESGTAGLLCAPDSDWMMSGRRWVARAGGFSDLAAAAGAGRCGAAGALAGGLGALAGAGDLGAGGLALGAGVSSMLGWVSLLVWAAGGAFAAGVLGFAAGAQAARASAAAP